MYYEIAPAPDFTLRMWLSEEEKNGPSVITQPNWPDGTPWGSVKEVTAWAEQLIIARVDETADMPGPSPAEPVTKRTPPEDLPITLTPNKLDEIVAAKVAAILAEKGL